MALHLQSGLKHQIVCVDILRPNEVIIEGEPRAQTTFTGLGPPQNRFCQYLDCI